MPQKNAAAATIVTTGEDTQTRVTSARSFYRDVLSKKISVVKPVQDDLLSKERECCSRATD